MGNLNKHNAKMEKTQYNGENSYLRYGVCEMQGWRKYMV